MIARKVAKRALGAVWQAMLELAEGGADHVAYPALHTRHIGAVKPRLLRQVFLLPAARDPHSGEVSRKAATMSMARSSVRARLMATRSKTWPRASASALRTSTRPSERAHRSAEREHGERASREARRLVGATDVFEVRRSAPLSDARFN